MAGLDLAQRRNAGEALVGCELAAWREAATRRRRQHVRHRSGDRLEALLGLAGPIETRDGANEALRVGMHRLCEKLPDRRLLHDLAGIHDDNALGHLGDDPHGVRDEHHGGAALAAYCACYGRWVEAEKKLAETPTLLKMPSGHIQMSPWLTISNKQMELMARYMTELGLTPSSRSRLTVQMPTGPKPWETLRADAGPP